MVDPGAGWRITSELIFNKHNMRLWTRFICLEQDEWRAVVNTVMKIWVT
jgi:hypothetical protein